MYDLEFWTPELLTEEKINEICTWLMRWQKAKVMAESIMEEKLDIDPRLITAMHYIEDLIRHLGALKQND